MLNGAASLRLPAKLPWEPGAIVAVIHELAIGLDRSLAGRDVAADLARPDRFVAVSEAVRDEVERRGVPRDRIGVAHGWVPTPRLAGEGAPVGWPVPAGAPVVGACGTIGWRKGTDLLLAAAQQLDPEVHVVWVGSTDRPVEAARYRREVRLRGLAGRVHLVGEQDRPEAWFAQFDIFALTSREDPFPLVALEAGRAGLPVVAFAGGGASELLARAGSADLVCPPLDVVGFAARLSDLLDDPVDRTRRGGALRAVVDQDHSQAVGAAALWKAVSGGRAAAQKNV